MGTRCERQKFCTLAPWARVLLVLGVLFHLSLLISWRAGFWNRFTFDSTATQGWRGWDFYALYQAGHNALTGVSVYVSDNEQIDVVAPRYTPYRYLPLPALTLGAILSLLPPLWALRLWVILTEAVYLTCIWATWRAAPCGNRGAILVAMWLFYTPYYLEIYMGQFSVIQGALLLLMLLAQRPWPGIAWVISLLWKQNTGLLLPVMVRMRRWRTLVVAVLAIGVTSGPYFARYPDALAAFLRNFAAGSPAHQLGNLGGRQWLYSITSALWPTLADSKQALIQAIWIGTIVAISLWATFRQGRPQGWLLIGLWMTSYFLIYRDVWEHHYVLLLPIWVVVYCQRPSALVLILFALMAIWTPYALIDPTGWAAFHAPMRWTPLTPRIVDILYHSAKAVPALVLWLCLIHWTLRPDPVSPEAVRSLR